MKTLFATNKTFMITGTDHDTQGTDTMTPNTFYTWRTKKNADGTFNAIALQITSRKTRNENGSFADTIVMHDEQLSTRARAKGRAIQWNRYYRANPDAAALRVKTLQGEVAA